ncbi:MAG: hypothetical protein GX493_02935 [Firmicutes bacterium]|nr:hypothetical protein [Bacillota bacterium]
MSKKRSLHVMIDAEVYERLRYICFYEQTTLAEVIRQLLADYLAQKTADPGTGQNAIPRQRRL